VVATRWADDYLKRKTPRTPGAAAEAENDRRLLDLAEVVSVADVLSGPELATAGVLAETDTRIRRALDAGDVGFTQMLAAGPDLLHRCRHAPDPYAEAVISFAADTRRLGLLTPITESMFTSAVDGYLRTRQRRNRPAEWLADALAFGGQELHGGVSALIPLDENPAGYVAADYVAQHIRRTDCPPRTAWETLISTAERAEDLRRLAAGATARMRYCHAEQALRRLLDRHGEGADALAGLLLRAGRDEEAADLLRRHLAKEPGDKAAAVQLDRITALAGRIADLRAAAPPAAAGSAARHLAELFADDGEADALRARADAGSHLAAEDLASLLAERGAVGELRERADRGEQPAADALADLLGAHRRVPELQRRADAGDQAAARQLAKLLASDQTVDGAAVQAQLADLRRRIGSGDEAAARQLTALLFDLRSMDELRSEVDAGTSQAAERFVALHNADEAVDREYVDRLRAHGLDAGGKLYAPREA
jgi:hypothetical protein